MFCWPPPRGCDTKSHYLIRVSRMGWHWRGSSQATVRCRPLLACPIYRWLVARNPFWMIPSASGSDRKFLQHCATVPGCTFREIRPTDRRRCVCKHKWKSISHNWYLMHSAKRSDTTTWYDWYEYQNHWAPAPPPKNRWFDRMFNKTSSAIGSRKISQKPNAASYKAPGVQLLNAVAQIWHPATQRLQACHGVTAGKTTGSTLEKPHLLIWVYILYYSNLHYHVRFKKITCQICQISQILSWYILILHDLKWYGISPSGSSAKLLG